ncbi:MAG: lipoprotein-releasing system ATP-binding protein LolD [Coxiella sp. (in: Bacteria)]|nr:MAG: lipoprotein-releasing system ATP-binding protein LolD [Coxiella sp. (in: g-proteobacteria)]
MNNDDPVLYCHDVTKSYIDGKLHVDVLKGVEIEVLAGECLAIIGASGSGKTTLLQILGGLDNPTSGEVRIAGQDLLHMSEKEKGHFRNRNLGFIYQFHHLLPEFNALENVAMPLLIRGLSHKEAQAKAAVFIERVGLKDRMMHFIGELSGGERQRIAVARALVTEPACVLADEPTGNLDQETADHVFNVMMELNREFNTSFIMVTHNKELANKHDRVLSLEQGQLVERKT